MTTRSVRGILTLVAVGAALSACSSQPMVTRIDPNTAIDLSGEWNDADSKLVADEMIKDALSRPWVTRYMQANGGKSPAVVVSNVRNLSSEHINTRTFMNDVGGAFVNSGSVTVSYDGADREQQRAEREDQQANASADTRARVRNERAANFRLAGELNTITDQQGGVTVKAYQVILRLTDIESNDVVWQGKKEIKKVVDRKRFRS